MIITCSRCGEQDWMFDEYRYEVVTKECRYCGNIDRIEYGFMKKNPAVGPGLEDS